MGWLIPALGLAACAVSAASYRPKEQNNALIEIQTRWETEKAKNAMNTTKTAPERAAQLEQLIEPGRDLMQPEPVLMRVHEEKAEVAAAHAEQEVERLKEQTEEASIVEKCAEEPANKAPKAVRMGVAKLAQAAQAEHGRSQGAHEEADTEMAVVKKEAEMGQQAADEKLREVQDAQKEKDAKEEVERRLKEGIRPVVMPTLEEIAFVKQRIRYRENCFHFAVAGISNSGRSLLLDAFRGLQINDTGTAVVDVTETTLQIICFADTDSENPIIWHDILGAGSLTASLSFSIIDSP